MDSLVKDSFVEKYFQVLDMDHLRANGRAGLG